MSINQQIDDGMDSYLNLLNELMKKYNISSLNWKNADFKDPYHWPRSETEEDELSSTQLAPIQFRRFSRYLLHLSELRLKESTFTVFNNHASNILLPYSSLTNGTIRLPSPLPLHTLVLTPLEITPQSITYLFDLLKLASQLKVLTLGIRGLPKGNTKLDVQQSSLPTNLSVEEFTIDLWSFKTDKELTTCLNLFLGSVDTIFPSLRKFSLQSHREKTEYQSKKKASTLKLGSFLKNLGKLQHLQTLYIESDICKGITIDSLEGCSRLTSLKIVTNPLLESAKLKGIPQNVTDLNLTFRLLKKSGDVRFAPGHQQLISDYFTSFKANKIACDNIQILTLSGYEVFPKIAGLMQFPSLVKFSLIDGRIIEEDLARILNWEGLVSLKELNLSKSLIVDSKIMQSNHRIFTVLENTRIAEQLEVLDFSHFRLSQELQVPKDSRKFKNLRELNFKRTYLNGDGLRSIIDSRFPKLEVLDIQDIKISPIEAIDILSQKIKLIRQMKFIYLSPNRTLSTFGDVSEIEKPLRKFEEKASGPPRIRIISDFCTLSDYFDQNEFIHYK